MGRKVGPFAVNLLRLALSAVILISVMGLRHLLGENLNFPGIFSWFWLGGSGIVGLAIGDFFLYRALTTDGPEKTSQILTIAPAATAIMAWLFLKEILSLPQIGGMAITLAGVFLAAWGAGRNRRLNASLETNQNQSAVKPVRKPVHYLMDGAWAAVWAGLFQGLGTVMARHAFLSDADIDPILATTIRITSGAVVIWFFARTQGPLRPVLAGSSHPKVIKLLIGGTLAGPLTGMICYVAALKYAAAGVVTTITFMSPLIVIPLGAWYYKTRIGSTAIVGTVISLAGVILLGFG